MKYSFEEIDHMEDLHVFYSVPARADNFEREEHITDFLKMIDQNKSRRWIWIIDFKELTYSKYMPLNYVSRLYTYLRTEHTTSLQQVWFLNLNAWVQMLMTFFVSAKVRVLTDEPLETLSLMQAAGIPFRHQNKLLAAISVHSKPVPVP